jgi:hypothetical protein
MSTHHQLIPARRFTTSGAGLQPGLLALCAVDAALLVASGLIHLHLWNIAYRHVTTGHLNVLFMVQVISCFVAALSLLVLRRAIVAVGSAALMAGTFIGFLISRYRTAGLFGFHVGFSSADAKWALAIEITATVLLLATTMAMLRTSDRRG